MARKKQVQTRIPADMKDELDQYQENRNISQADAVRRLVRIGLDREQQATPDGGAVMDRLDEQAATIEQLRDKQEAAQRRQTAYILVGLAYIGATIVTGASSILWGVVGIVLLVGLIYTSLDIES